MSFPSYRLHFSFITPRLFAAPLPAERVISLHPMLLKLPAPQVWGDKLSPSVSTVITTTKRSNWSVANHQTINIEKILTLKPDLIIAWPSGNPPRELAKLCQLGITIYDCKHEHLMKSPIISKCSASMRQS